MSIGYCVLGTGTKFVLGSFYQYSSIPNSSILSFSFSQIRTFNGEIIPMPIARVQIIAIVASLCFLALIARLIVKGKLREEYAIIWIVSSVLLIAFSFWRNGLQVMSDLIGVAAPPNLVFTGAIFAVLVYLLHLSVVVSKLQEQNKRLAQDIALMKQKEKETENRSENISQ